MVIDGLLKDKTIFICEDSYKKYLLKTMNQNHLFLDVKFFTKNEFMREYLFNYGEDALYYLVNKYHFKVEVAIMYLNNLIYLNENNYHSDKLNFLKMLKEELDEHKLLKYNPLFKKYISNYKIVVVGYSYLDSNEEKIFNELNSIYVKEIPSFKPSEVYEFTSINEEVNAVFKEIAKLIEKGININKIKIVNVSDDYYPFMERYAKFYQIPIKNTHEISLYSTTVAKKFLSNLSSGIDYAYETIKDMDEEIVNKIINICNKYLFVTDMTILKNLLIYEFKKTNIKQEELKDFVDIINIEDYISLDDYIFLVNFNTGSIPHVMLDEDYIDDELKKEMGLKNTIQKNKEYKEYIINKLQTIKNLWISYKLSDGKSKYFPSILVTDMNLSKKVYHNDLLNSYSLLNDKINYAKSLYNYNTFGILGNLPLYQNTLGDIHYNSYDNKFKGIDKNDLKDFLKNQLNLSYSSLSNYHKCAFRYFLADVLKIDPYEDTFEGFIGSLFHDVLEKSLQNNLNDDETLDEIKRYLKDANRPLTKKEEFFIDKIKEDMLFVKKTILEQQNDISLKDAYFEKKISIDKSIDDMFINFKGFIDKILYKVEDDKTYVVIIDYKTGNVSADLKYVPYGLDMQLPIYLYLVNKSNVFVNPVIIGFYLQFILNNNILRDNGKTYEEKKKDNLKLVGYSTDNISHLVMFDKNYENSFLINGLRVKNDGSFYKSAKVLNNDDLNNLVKVTEDIIDEDIKKILNGEFTINPKKIGFDKEVGCAFCHFKDICYKTTDDDVILPEINEEAGDLSE